MRPVLLIKEIMQYKDSQRQLNTSRQVQQFDIELPSANKNLEIINAIESGLEEANRNVLRQFIGDLPFNSILKENSDHNIALDNVIALLFEVLMSPREDESDSAMNLFKEGIKKRRDFRIAACNRGGILGRGANIIAHSHQQNNLDHQSQSPLNQTIAEVQQSQYKRASQSPPVIIQHQFITTHSLLNLIEVLQELAKIEIRLWNPVETDELIISLLNTTQNEQQKDQKDNNIEDGMEENNLNICKGNLLNFLKQKKLKGINVDQQQQFSIINALKYENEQLEKEKEENELINRNEKIILNGQLQAQQEEIEKLKQLLEREKVVSNDALLKKQESETKQRDFEEILKQRDQTITQHEIQEKEDVDLRRKAEEQEKQEKEEKERQIIRANNAEKENLEFKEQNLKLTVDLQNEKETKDKEKQLKEEFKTKYEEELRKRQELNNQIKIMIEENDYMKLVNQKDKLESELKQKQIQKKDKRELDYQMEQFFLAKELNENVYNNEKQQLNKKLEEEEQKYRINIEKQKEEFNNEKQQLKENNQIEKDQLIKKHEKEMQLEKDQRLNLDFQYRTEKIELIKDFETRYAKQINEHIKENKQLEEQIEKLKNEYSQDKIKLLNDNKINSEQLIEQHQLEIVKISDENQKEKDLLIKNHEEQIIQLNEQTQNQIKDINEKYKLDREELIQKFELEQEQIIQKHDDENKKQKQSFDEEQNQRRKVEQENVILNDQLQNTQEELNKLKIGFDQVKKIRQELEDELQKVKLQYQEEKRKNIIIEHDIIIEIEQRQTLEYKLKIETEDKNKAIKDCKEEKEKRFDAEKRRIVAENRLIIEQEDKQRALIDANNIKMERDDEINKRRESQKQTRISKEEANKSESILLMIKQQRDELQIRLKDKEQQYKQLYEQRQDGLKKEAQQFGLQILEQNKDLESGKNLKKEKDELNEAQNQIERMNEQIDQLKTETIDLQHELQITQENLEIQKQELNKNQQTAKDEEDLKIKAEEQRWQLQGEYEVLILENARLKQTLGEERTQQEDQRIREEKRLNDERINKIELDKRDSDERIRLFEQRLKEADDRIQQLERPCSVCKQIGLQLNQPLIGSKDQKTKIKEQSEVLSIIISQTYQLDDDDEGKKRTIVSGIAEGLLQILQNYPLREITENNSKAYRHLAYTSDENKRLLYQKDPLPVMIRLLDHTESKIVNHAIVTICNFLYSEVDQQENKIHPHFQDLNKCDGINRMYQLFKKGPYKYSRDRAAIAIGLVLRSQEINVPVPAKQKGNANASMKQEVIAHLKMLMLDDPEQWIKDAAKDALKGLAKNEANRVEISKGGFECPE